MKLLLLLGSGDRELAATGDYLQKAADTLEPDIIATREWWASPSAAKDFLGTASKVSLPAGSLMVLNSKVFPGDYPADQYVSCVSAVSYPDEAGKRRVAAIPKRRCGGTSEGTERFTVPDFSTGALYGPYIHRNGWGAVAELDASLGKYGGISFAPLETPHIFPAKIGGRNVDVWHSICSDFVVPTGSRPAIGIESAYTEDGGWGYPCMQIPFWVYCNYGRGMVGVGDSAFLFEGNLWRAEPGAQVGPDHSLALDGGVERNGGRAPVEFGEIGNARAIDKNYALLVELYRNPLAEAAKP